MAHLSWPAFTERRHELHLLVAHALARVCDDPAGLMKVLIERLQLEGDFALSSVQTSEEITLFCAFKSAGDAALITDVLCAHEENQHQGWASEFHCSIDKATVDAVGRKPLL
ncbi:MAG: hypothetical protein J0H44_31120 [Alphaproteobacteria bacterium]|nr:hypothetical protein [Alphaproteobacteria bacterium]